MGSPEPFTLKAAHKQYIQNRHVQYLSIPFIHCPREQDERGVCQPFTLIAAWNRDTENRLLQNISFHFILARGFPDLTTLEHCDAQTAHGKFGRVPAIARVSTKIVIDSQ